MNRKQKTVCYLSKNMLRITACTLLLAGSHFGQVYAAPENSGLTENSLPAPANRTIKGKVVSATGEEIVGASIKEKGTSAGTITRTDGTFTLNAKSESPVLIISYIGYKSQTVAVGSKEQIQVVLEQDSKMVDEVVVIGYGTQRKGDVTSAVASVKAEDFTVGKIGDAAELVKGKIAGLSIVKSSGDPNATSSILLRGVSSIKGGYEPLVLVDGIENELTSVAPDNIASIDVLKDASAAAIYGTRGANGVILITTKSGKRDVKNSATYTSYVSFSEWYKTAKFMDTHDIIYGKTNFSYEGYDTDWLKAISRKAGFTQNHSLSLAGGTHSSTYSANVTYSDEQGIMKKSDSRNLKAQLDLTHYALDDIIKFNVNILHGTHKHTNNNNAYAYRQALIHNPSSPVYNADGSYNENLNLFQYYNPVAIQNEMIGDTRSSYSQLTGNVTLEPIKGWQTNLMLSTKKTESTSENFYSSNYYTLLKSTTRGAASKSSNLSRSDNMEITSRYNFSIKKSRISALLGYSYLYNVYDGFSAGNSDFPNQGYLYNSLGQGTALTDDDKHASMGSYQSDDHLIGFFGRATYAFDDKYNAMVSFRREGSSKFGINQKWGFFPSASLGWTISNEQFMKDLKWVNNLKVRAGYGKTGIIASENYKSLVLFNYGAYSDYLNKSGEWTKSLEVVQNVNKNLRWETTREINIGVDWEVLNSRLSGSIDLYHKKTSDLLYDYAVPVPPYLYSSTLYNVGDMSNKGIEVMISAKPVISKDFEWNTTMTFSHNENKLIRLSSELYKTDNFLEVGGVSDPISVPTHSMEVGHSLGDFWGLKSVGVSKNGNVIVQVSDGNGGWKLDEFDTKYNERANRQRLGNGMPKLVAGWNNTFKYKGFDLSLQFTGQFWFQILNTQRAFYENNSIAYNRLKSAADLHPAIDLNGQPVIDPATGKQMMVKLSSSMSQGVWSDYIENGDFLKLTNATIGYTFKIPSAWKKYINSARLYLSGQNLMCLTSYSGLDPEVSINTLAPGIDDRDKYPTVRSYTAGLSIKF